MKTSVLVLSVFFVFGSNALAVGSSQALNSEQIASASQMINAIKGGDPVEELISSAHSQISAALQQAKISGEIDVREGILSEGGTPMSQSVSVSLSVFQNGTKLGNLQIVKRTSPIKPETILATFVKE